MVRSMTAFARSEAEYEFGSVSWELRSLNHRYLEISLRLPEELRAQESAVRERINARLGRGKVDCGCRFQPAASQAVPTDVDPDNLQRLLDAVATVRAAAPDIGQPAALEILRWPGVVQEQSTDRDALRGNALELLDSALDELVENREREGAQIDTLLRQRCNAIGEQVDKARELMPAIRTSLRERMQQRLAELDVEADPGRLEQELVMQLQKIDVDEELDRLDGHIVEVRRVLGGDKPIGRRLDFLMQELNREANTLGSKSVAVDSTGISVELKVLIEQMREQVQNVE